MKTENNISYRNAQAQDIDRLKTILFNTFSAYRIAVPDNYSVADIDTIGSDTYSGSACVLLRDKTVIGFVISRPLNHACVELKRLYLIESERKKGLGQFLLERAFEYARNANYRIMRLETTSTFEEAVAVYKKNGFHELPDLKTAPGHDLVFEKKL